MKYVLALLALLLPTLAAAAPWKVDPATSTLGFTGSYDGEVFHGAFKHFTASISFDPADLASAKFDVTVQLKSVDTQASERDDTLAGSDFFDVAKTPTAHFVTTGFTRSDDGKIHAAGTLDLHGVKKPVTLAVTFTPDGNGATLKVETTLQRADWQLGASNDWAAISAAIHVEGNLRLTR